MILQYLQAIVLALITISVPFVATGITKLFVITYKYLTTKYGVTRTNQIATEALNVWNNIEEETRLGDLVGSKYDEFMARMSVKFPLLTPKRIYEFNKNIAGEFNKGKETVIKELDPTVATVIEKYVDKDGNELVKAIAPIV